MGALRGEGQLERFYGAPFVGDVYLVGGAIRELALGEKPRDYDFALSRQEDLSVVEATLKANAFTLGKKPLHTQRLVCDDGIVVDCTYFSGPIEKDLRRRDFTINAIAYDVGRRRLIDPLGGLGDLAGKIIRSPGSHVLSDDPLRMLKAFRHFATLKGFSMDGELLEAIGRMRGLIHQAAAERLKYELDLIVVSPRVYETLRLLEETGLLFELFSDLRALMEMDREKEFELKALGHTIGGFRYLTEHARSYALTTEEIRCVAYALLFHDLGKADTFSYDSKKKTVHFFHHEKRSQALATEVMERLRFSSQEIKTILSLIASHMRIFLITQNDSTEKAVRRLVYAMEERTPLLIVHTLCDMYGSSAGSENPSTRKVKSRCDEVFRAFHEWRKEPLPPLVTGRDLIALGFREGPAIGEALRTVRERQIAGDIMEKQQAIDLARQFLEGPTGKMG